MDSGGDLVSPATDKTFIFITGLHRSGTSLLHRLLRAHPEVSGFSGTGVPEDEGQHLQSVVLPAWAFGGPGRFGFDPRSHLDDSSPLATPRNAARIFAEWSRHWDLSKSMLLEKSPTTLVRMRFFQALFPNSAFVLILRHPIAVSVATNKWSRTGACSRMEHTLACYERALGDLSYLRRAFLLRYEDLVAAPAQAIDATCAFLGLAPIPVAEPVRPNVNAAYFAAWRRGPLGLLRQGIARRQEPRARRLGYSLRAPERLLPLSSLKLAAEFFDHREVLSAPQRTAWWAP